MSTRDVIKNSVLEGFVDGNVSTVQIFVALAIAIVIGLYIFFIYRVTTKSGFYNKSFNKSLASMPLITAAIMLAMQSNLVISLGMVGALSIVRFRNAVKDSSDLTYLFWSISVGIVVGTGLYELAIILSLCMTVLQIGLDLLPAVRAPYLLVVSGGKNAKEDVLLQAVKTYAAKAKIRSRNVTEKGTEWIVELQVKDAAALVGCVAELEDVSSVNLLTHDGAVRF